MIFKIIFTWWNKQTVGTFLKQFLLENTLEKTIMEINIIKIDMIKDGLFIQKRLRQQKFLLIGIYGCIILLIKFQIRWKKNTIGKRTILKT